MTKPLDVTLNFP